MIKAFGGETEKARILEDGMTGKWTNEQVEILKKGWGGENTSVWGRYHLSCNKWRTPAEKVTSEDRVRTEGEITAMEADERR